MSQQEQMPVVRRRVNISTSVKGVQTADATFEVTSGEMTRPQFADSATDFFDWVNRTWPPPVETPKLEKLVAPKENHAD